MDVDLRERAAKCFAGGVGALWNYLPTGGPVHITKCEAARICDSSGKWYVDLNMGHGSLILGHNPAVLATSSGSLAPYETESHIELAEAIQKCVKGCDLLRFACTGADVCSAAIRLAR